MFRIGTVLPDRRNPQLATAEGSEGRTPEFAALMHGAIVIAPKLSVNPPLDKFFSSRCVSPTDRKSCAYACHGSNLAKLPKAALAGKFGAIRETVVKSCRCKGAPVEVLKLALIRASGKDINRVGQDNLALA